jgi:pilus assembly protein Flp/PilA
VAALFPDQPILAGATASSSGDEVYRIETIETPARATGKKNRIAYTFSKLRNVIVASRCLTRLVTQRLPTEFWIMKMLLARFAKDESGATAIEYGLIAAGISVAIITVVKGVGTSLTNTFSSVSTALK